MCLMEGGGRRGGGEGLIPLCLKILCNNVELIVHCLCNRLLFRKLFFPWCVTQRKMTSFGKRTLMNLLELNMVSAVGIDLKFQFNPSGATCLHSTVVNIKIQENFKVYFTLNNHTLYKRSTVKLPSSSHPLLSGQ